MTRKLIITPVLNGYRVQVGCQEVVFNEPEELIHALRDYLMEPVKVEKEYLSRSINRDLAMVSEPTPVPAPPTPPPQGMGDPQCYGGAGQSDLGLGSLRSR